LRAFSRASLVRVMPPEERFETLTALRGTTELSTGSTARWGRIQAVRKQ
jgi:hypothetical protein